MIRNLLTSKIPLQHVSFEAIPNEEDDWIVFRTDAAINADNQAQTGDASKSCQLSSRDTIRFLAGLDYTMQSKRPNQSDFETIPDSVRTFVRGMLAQGRLLSSADLDTNGQFIRLSFGDVDAAISGYM